MLYIEIEEKLKKHLKNRVFNFYARSINIIKANFEHIVFEERKENSSENIDTPFYRLNLICMIHNIDDEYDLVEWTGYAINNNGISIVDDEVNPIFTSLNHQVYEQYSMPNCEKNESSLLLQAYAADRPLYYTDNKGILKENRYGSLNVITYLDNKTHIFDYEGHYGFKSPVEENVFYTFETDTIHKYTIETGNENNKLYDGKINLKEEICFKTNKFAIYGIDTIKDSNTDLPFVSDILKLNPIVITTAYDKRLIWANDKIKPTTYDENTSFDIDSEFIIDSEDKIISISKDKPKVIQKTN